MKCPDCGCPIAVQNADPTRCVGCERTWTIGEILTDLSDRVEGLERRERERAALAREQQEREG